MSFNTTLRGYNDGSLTQKSDGLSTISKYNPVMEELDNPNSTHAFKRFEEGEFVEHFQCYFRLVDIPRNAFYALAMAATKESPR